MKKLNFLIASLILSHFSFSQELFLVGGAGTESVTAGGSVSWSIGEIVTSTASSVSNDVTQGFHQGHIYVTGIEGLDEIEISVFPNPTSEYVTIESPEPINVSIFDATGRLVANYYFVDQTNQVDVTDFARGTYNLIIETTNQTKKTARLVVM